MAFIGKNLAAARLNEEGAVIERAAAVGNISACNTHAVEVGKFLQKLNGMECMECGSCTFVCPAKRPLTQAFKEMRKTVAANRRKKAQGGK